ncbi:MAG: hypothetical protein KGI29_02180 [Pseudomonadota bacterium]|nr:hypothetical protein [Pseudomonadota bacterium]MDE3037424.1 hypothetical protein [Pseudomonadota bacterium]
MSTSAISGFNAATWLGQIEGVTAPTPAPAAAPTSTTSAAAPAPGGLGIPSNVLALLQGTGMGSTTSDQLSTLLGDGGNGISPTDPLAGVYNSLLSGNTTTGPIEAAVAAANQQAAQSAAQTDNATWNLIANLNTASNAYNTTLLQQAQAVEQANSSLIA